MQKICHYWHNKNLGLLLLRLGVGITFIMHGWAKFADMGKTVGFFGTIGFPAFFAYLVAFVELVGGIALIVGFCTRYTAKILTIVMLVALFYVKISKFDAAFLGGYELDFVLLFALLALMFTGSGKYSIKCWCRGSSKCCGCDKSAGNCSTCSVGGSSDEKCHCSPSCNCAAGKCNCPSK